MSNRVAHAASILFLVGAIALAPAALAVKGGGGGKGKPGPTPTGSFSLVLVNSTDGVPHWGQRITFNVTSTARYYFVAVSCYQSGVRVYRADKGFYPGWPWSKEFTLLSYAWSGGAADCNAELYSQYSDGSNHRTLATMSFAVAA
jgi:hypothetical protein